MIYIILIAMLLLFPIPLKIKLVFNNKVLKIFIFKKEININKKHNIKEKMDHIKNNDLKENKRKLHEDISKKKLLNININNFFKPTLKIHFKIDFGFNDAAYTAMVYGLVNIFPGFIYNILAKFFKIKKFKFNVQPVFNSEIIYAEISSIFFVNLVKVIYIVLKIFIVYLKEKKSSHSKIQRSGTVG